MALRVDPAKQITPLPEEDNSPVGPRIEIGDFSGPLDLLYYLIEKHEIDLFDIPIASLTFQYLTFLSNAQELDMDIASDFLVMGATLVQMKSQMMLPSDRDKLNAEDPRDELVLRLLAYRRCKYIAERLREQEGLYAGAVFRVPENPAKLGLKPPDPTLQYADETEFQSERFIRAASTLQARNQARFQDLSEKMDYIVNREQMSIKEWIERLWTLLLTEREVSFDKTFPPDTGKEKRLTGFLSVLELLKQNRIFALQDRPFADIVIRKQEETLP